MVRGLVVSAHGGVSAKAIAGEVLDAGRVRPIVVVTVDDRYPACAIDATWIMNQLDGLADVHILTKGSLHDFSSLLPAGADVYGNAVRVYEPMIFKTKSESRFRAHPAFGADQAMRAMKGAVNDALACARWPSQPVHPKALPLTQALPLQTTAIVRGFMQEATAALAVGPLGELFTIYGESTIPGVRLDWLLGSGDEISGAVAPSSSTLDIRSSLMTHRLAQTYKHGQTVLALAQNVKAKSLELTLFPGSTWTIPTENGTEDSSQSNPLASEGEVVCALFYRENGAVRLSLAMADSDSVIAAPPLLVGGKPWLVLGRNLTNMEASETSRLPQTSILSEPAEVGTKDLAEESSDDPPSSGVGLEYSLGVVTSGEADRTSSLLSSPVHGQSSLRPEDISSSAKPSLLSQGIGRVGIEIELKQTQRDLVLEHKENVELRHQLDQALEKNRSLKLDNDGLKKRLREAATAAVTSSIDRPLFLDPKEALRHEIYSVWATYIPGEEKSRYPAPESFEIGDQLADSLDRCTDASTREKALQTIVDLLVERQERQRIMVKKPLRTGSQASKPQLMRWDGASAWRVRVENHTPQALRLHYWLRPDKTVELSKVDKHDAFAA